MTKTRRVPLMSMAEARYCMTQREVAALLKLSPQRVGQIEGRAIRKMRRAIKRLAREEELDVGEWIRGFERG